MRPCTLWHYTSHAWLIDARATMRRNRTEAEAYIRRYETRPIGPFWVAVYRAIVWEHECAHEGARREDMPLDPVYSMLLQNLDPGRPPLALELVFKRPTPDPSRLRQVAYLRDREHGLVVR